MAACACADQKLQYGYQALREVLELGEDADFLPDEDGKVQPDMTSPAPLTHKNIRGREYYRKDKIKLICMEVNNKTAPVTGQQDQNTISLDLMNRMKLHCMAWQRLSGKVLPAPLRNP